jgi:tetratricopeptide (TPR) repeat protein
MVWQQLGDVLRELGERDEAEIAGRLAEAYLKVLKLQPELVMAEDKLTELLAVGIPTSDVKTVSQSAISADNGNIQTNPKNYAAYHKLGEGFAKRKKWQDAIAAYSQAIKLNPEYSWSYHCMGEAMAENGNIEDGIIAFRRATELNPNFSGTYNKLGNLLTKVGRIDEASICYEYFIELELRNCTELPKSGFQAQITSQDSLVCFAKQPLNLKVKVKNISNVSWNNKGLRFFSKYGIFLGHHWKDKNGQVLRWDDSRCSFDEELVAGQEVELNLMVNPPELPGNYQLQLDMVQEGVGWFSELGSNVKNIDVNVQKIANASNIAKAIEEYRNMQTN